jgi:succinate dehydrogenase / fumarate reductase flavoprotein subunit
VLLKLDHLGPEVINKRLPSIREIAIKFANVDPIKEPIPVVPTIHYQMGGIPTNVHGQVVAPKDGDPNAVVNGFYAVGECACVSVHGANRLGTNSLLDLIVFGRAAGDFVVSQRLDREPHKPLPKDAGDAALARLARIEANTGGESSATIAADLRSAMQAHCGVYRNQELLSAGVAKVREIEQRVQRVVLNDKSRTFNTARVEALELDNLIETAKATVVSAEARRESRGAQARSDYPERDDAGWLKHTLWYRDGNRLDYKPVNLKPVSVDAFPPKARSY